MKKLKTDFSVNPEKLVSVLNYDGTPITADDILNVSIIIEYIQPFSASLLGDEVLISVDKTKKMSFETHLGKRSGGWVADIKIFTEIRVYVPPLARV